MSRHLRRWLNDKALAENFGDTYEGRIAIVTEQIIRNRFTGQKQLEPVVQFEDGWMLVPNLSQRRALINMFGVETDDWIGEVIAVCRVCITKNDAKTGLTKQSWQKVVKLPAPKSLRREA